MAGRFSQATLEQIRAASDIVDVIGSYVPLKRAGGNFRALCPFHKEKSPSFNVNPQRQIFHCFGCGKGGDVFGFVRDFEGLSFPEAVKRLADRANIPLELESGGPETEARHLKDQLLQIHEQICTRWQAALANDAAGQIARDYLAKRGVSDEAVKLFRIGYAPELWDDTVNWAKSKGYDPALVERAGLVVRKEDTGHHYDRFRGRLMFPICDEQGRVIGFSGRILRGDEKSAKYVNSPETPIFVKSRVFFGLDKSKRALLEENTAIVCEGQLDLIACFMAGVKNIVAPQGTAFTAEHARILKRYAEEVVLCFDSDSAGQNAAVRALDSLLAAGLAVRVAVVPAPHDPDSFIKEHGGFAFKQLITLAEGFFDFYLKRLCATNDLATDKGRLAVLRGMAEAVNKTGNAVLVDGYAQKTALRLAVAPEAVRAEFRKAPKPRPEAEPEEPPAELPEEVASPPSTQEVWLLRLLLCHDDLAEWAVAHLDPDWVPHPLVRQIVQERLAACRDGSWSSVAAFLDAVESPARQALITEVTATSQPMAKPEQQLADLARRLRNAQLDQEMAQLINLASQPETAEAQRNELLRRRMELSQLKLQPLQPLPGSAEEPF